MKLNKEVVDKVAAQLGIELGASAPRTTKLLNAVSENPVFCETTFGYVKHDTALKLWKALLESESKLSQTEAALRRLLRQQWLGAKPPTDEQMKNMVDAALTQAAAQDKNATT